MSKNDIGSAEDAAEVMGLSVSQFNEQRLAATYEYDPVSETIAPLPDLDDLPEGTSLRQYMRGRHLCAPTLAGQRWPGGKWEYNLTRLQMLRDEGWPGARYPDHGTRARPR